MRHRIHPGLAQRRDEDQVASGLGHLRPVQPDHPAVQVRPRERLAGGHPGLAGRHLVVREDQVAAAALHVEVGAEQVQRDRTCTRCASPAGRRPTGIPRTAHPHGPAARPDSPTGPSCPIGPDHRPARRTGPGPRPRRAGTGNRTRHHWPGRSTDRGVRGRPPGTPRRAVAAPRSARRSAGSASTAPTKCRRRKHVQRGHVLPVELDLPLGQVRPVDPGLPRPLQQRVVDVGHVLHVACGELRAERDRRRRPAAGAGAGDRGRLVRPGRAADPALPGGHGRAERASADGTSWARSKPCRGSSS